MFLGCLHRRTFIRSCQSISMGLRSGLSLSRAHLWLFHSPVDLLLCLGPLSCCTSISLWASTFWRVSHVLLQNIWINLRIHSSTDDGELSRSWGLHHVSHWAWAGDACNCSLFPPHFYCSSQTIQLVSFTTEYCPSSGTSSAVAHLNVQQFFRQKWLPSWCSLMKSIVV